MVSAKFLSWKKNGGTSWEPLGRIGGAPGAPRKAAKKHISFNASANKVTLVRPPPKSEKDDYWFQESEMKVLKPVCFTLRRGDKISLDIETALMVTAVLATTVADVSPASLVYKKRELLNKPLATEWATTALEVCNNKHATLLDSLEERLAVVSGMGCSKKELMARRKAVQWFTACTALAADSLTNTNLVLPAGSYLLRCRGLHDLQVFGQVEDIVRKLA